jgi:hypothetical protein
LAATVAATITHLEEGTDMPAENMFSGFTFDRDYIDRETARNGGPELDSIAHNTADWTADDFASFTDQGVALELRLLALLRDGVAVDDPATFTVLDEDLAMQRKLWNPDRQGYVQLAESLVESGEWTDHLNSLDPRLAGYLREAMLAYAAARLT